MHEGFYLVASGLDNRVSPSGERMTCSTTSNRGTSREVTNNGIAWRSLSAEALQVQENEMMYLGCPHDCAECQDRETPTGFNFVQ